MKPTEREIRAVRFPREILIEVVQELSKDR